MNKRKLGLGNVFTGSEIRFTIKGGVVTAEEVSAELFGIETGIHRQIFAASGYKPSLHAVTPTEAVKQLRNIVAWVDTTAGGWRF